jgi:hypothetical protein
MNTALWQKWLNEDVDDLKEALLYYGITGILARFEDWLKFNKHLIKED